jgi:hypothetical protein
MLTLAALIGLNMRSVWPGERDNHHGIRYWLPEEFRDNPRHWEYGWPMKAYRYVPFGDLTGDGFRLQFSWEPALFDAFLAVAILIAGAVVWESIIRRREARKT